MRRRWRTQLVTPNARQCCNLVMAGASEVSAQIASLLAIDDSHGIWAVRTDHGTLWGDPMQGVLDRAGCNIGPAAWLLGFYRWAPSLPDRTAHRTPSRGFRHTNQADFNKELTVSAVRSR